MFVYCLKDIYTYQNKYLKNNNSKVGIIIILQNLQIHKTLKQNFMKQKS